MLVHDAQAPADRGGGIELDPVEVAHEEGEKPHEEADRRAHERRAEPVAPEPQAIDGDRLEAGGEEGPFQPRAAVGGMVLAQQLEELAEGDPRAGPILGGREITWGRVGGNLGTSARHMRNAAPGAGVPARLPPPGPGGSDLRIRGA